MDESYFKDKISAYLDNELSAEERVIVEEYIRAHPDAQEQLARLAALKKVSDRHLSLGGDDLYWERNARKIESAIGAVSAEKVSAPQKSEWMRHWWKLTAVAASVGILFFIATNKDEIEKKALPTDAPSTVVRTEAARDSAAPIKSTTVMEKESQEQYDIGVSIEREKQGKATVADKLPVVEKFDVASTEKVQKEATIAKSTGEADKNIVLSKSTPPTDEVAESAPPAEGVTAFADVAPDSSVLTLAHWTAVRDSLSPLFASSQVKSKSQSPLSKALRAPLTTSLREKSSDATKSQMLSWLEANYHIAQMSSDMVQRVSAIDALRGFESNTDTAISSTASEYLKRLLER